MVLGLLGLVAPGCSPCEILLEDEEAVERLVDASVAGLGKIPIALRVEVKEALRAVVASEGQSRAAECAESIRRHLQEIKVPHTASESIELAMEALRIEGLKAIKKWRAWQAFKNADRIDSLGTFMYSRPDQGTLVIDVATTGTREGGFFNCSEQTKSKVYREVVARVEEALQDARGRLPWLDGLLSRWGSEVLALQCVGAVCPLGGGEEDMAALGSAVLFVEHRLRHCSLVSSDSPEQAAAAVVGSLTDFEAWKEQESKAADTKRDAAEMRAGHRETFAALDLFRSPESLCAECGSQTYLVEEHLRRSDEPSDWLRVCPRCRVVKRC